MKKILYLLCTMTLVSCSDDDTSAPGMNTEGTRLVKAVSIGPEGDIYTSEYFYQGTHLSTAQSGGITTAFAYSGDLITAVGNGTSQMICEYDDQNRLVRGSTSGYSNVYVYNADNTVTVTDYEGAETPENIKSVVTLYYDGGEIVKKVKTSPNSSNVITYTMTHDSQNNSHLSLTGYYGVYFYYGFSIGAMGKAHNIQTMTIEVTGSSPYTDYYAYQYDYNSFGYPTQQRQVDEDGNPTGYVVNFYYE
ncbi:hypothetical protein [Flavobacterium sp.]|uniref:hypothetical protein n=1 Tax=Flavobacterium sp. TaxID=239 RepID=UPI0039E3290D